MKSVKINGIIVPISSIESVHPVKDCSFKVVLLTGKELVVKVESFLTEDAFVWFRVGLLKKMGLNGELRELDNTQTCLLLNLSKNEDKH